MSFLGENYVVEPEHETIDCSEQFKLQKDQATGYVYCLKHGQSIDERKQEKKL